MIFIKTIAIYLIFIFVGTTIIGVILRGFYTPKYNVKTERLKDMVKKYNSANIKLTVFFFILSIIYIFILYRFINWGVAVLGLLLMLFRIPDAIVEIRTGEKINKKNLRQKPIDILAGVFMWITLPLIWICLKYLS